MKTGRGSNTGPQGNTGREIKHVYGADGRLIESVPHVPGEPYHGSRELLWLGARDGFMETPDGPVRVQKDKVYGVARIAPAGAGGNVLRLAGSLRSGDVSLEIGNPDELEAADNKSFSADLILSSESTSHGLAQFSIFTPPSRTSTRERAGSPRSGSAPWAPTPSASSASAST